MIDHPGGSSLPVAEQKDTFLIKYLAGYEILSNFVPQSSGLTGFDSGPRWYVSMQCVAWLAL